MKYHAIVCGRKRGAIGGCYNFDTYFESDCADWIELRNLARQSANDDDMEVMHVVDVRQDTTAE